MQAILSKISYTVSINRNDPVTITIYGWIQFKTANQR